MQGIRCWHGTLQGRHKTKPTNYQVKQETTKKKDTINMELPTAITGKNSYSFFYSQATCIIS